MALIFGVLFGINSDFEMFMVLLGVLLFYVPYVLGTTFMLFTREELAKDMQDFREAIKVINKTVKPTVPTTTPAKKTTKTITKTTVNGVETITETLTQEY
jgi:hypothetical protein